MNGAVPVRGVSAPVFPQLKVEFDAFARLDIDLRSAA
jgi:hypothetical protein